jgi:hypothetical protein
MIMTHAEALEELRSYRPLRDLHTKNDAQELKRRGMLVEFLNAKTVDMQYVKQRDLLIPQAERIASLRFDRKRDTDKCAPWTRAFLKAMDDLWRMR